MTFRSICPQFSSKPLGHIRQNGGKHLSQRLPFPPTSLQVSKVVFNIFLGRWSNYLHKRDAIKEMQKKSLKKKFRIRPYSSPFHTGTSWATKPHVESEENFKKISRPHTVDWSQLNDLRNNSWPEYEIQSKENILPVELQYNERNFKEKKIKNKMRFKPVPPRLRWLDATSN